VITHAFHPAIQIPIPVPVNINFGFDEFAPEIMFGQAKLADSRYDSPVEACMAVAIEF
jgi:hypothetical protein